jgi:UDPglucose--hexose-1-phosphate uridylyltransferase
VVESPRHNTCAALELPDQVTLTLETFKIRSREIAQDPRIEQIICFHNHGLRAGASLVHPHSQIIALPVVPSNIRTRIEEARRYFDDTGQCVFCYMLSDELRSGVRIVAENEDFAAFVLYAALSPFHMWIVPRRHEPTFLRTSGSQLAALGDILHQVLRKVYVGLKDPDYNYAIRTAPLHDPGYDYLHWYITLIPRVTRSAGFELGSGMFINTALPERSAEFLRSVDIS